MRETAQSRTNHWNDDHTASTRKARLAGRATGDPTGAPRSAGPAAPGNEACAATMALASLAVRATVLVSTNSTNTVTYFDEDDSCCDCGEHIANPHAPTCLEQAVISLREDADANEQAHRATLAAGGYAGDEYDRARGYVQVNHHMIATSQHLAADLIELDRAEAIDLRTWPAAATFLAGVTGDQSPAAG